MKIGDEVYVHGYVDEIRKDTVIIKNKGGYFGTCKKEIDAEFPFSQLVYPADKFSVVVHNGKIHLINVNEVELKVTAEQKLQMDLSVEEFVEGMKNLKMEVKRTDCDRHAIVNDEGERAYNCIGCQTDCPWK